MKKLGLFIATIALGMGSSFAQDVQPLISLTPGQTDVSVVTQTGEKHDAQVNQQGTYNSSFILQESSSNKAVVDQINTAGFWVPTQSDIKQTGEGNIAEVDQISTWPIASINTESVKLWLPLTASILQSGSWNTALQTQVKFMNKATITQTGGENVAIQEQDLDMTDDFFGSFNTADINQSGYGNDALQTQNGMLNVAQILQPGNLNTAEQHQDLYSLGNNAFVSQSGNSNTSFQSQLGYINEANIYQLSDKNDAEQTQISELGITIDSESPDVLDGELALNKATIIQKEGEENLALQMQDNNGIFVFNEAISVQCGTKNTSSQNQLGGANYSLIQQDGCSNSAFVGQSILPQPR